MRRGRYGVIDVRDGRLAAIHLRPWPKLVSALEVEWLGRRWHEATPGDRCLLYYNQPRRHPNFLALKYIVSHRDCTLATFNRALLALDEVARVKRSDAILCDAWNLRISDRLFARWGWEPHKPGRWHRHFIKRFYGEYPPPRPLAVDASCTRAGKRLLASTDLAVAAGQTALVGVGASGYDSAPCQNCAHAARGKVGAKRAIPRSRFRQHDFRRRPLIRRCARHVAGIHFVANEIVRGDQHASRRACELADVRSAAGAVRLRQQSVRAAKAKPNACSSSRSRCNSATTNCKAAPAPWIATIRSWKRCWRKRGSKARCSKISWRRVRDQLARLSAQLAQVRDEKQLTDKQTEALMASTRRRAGARSRPTTACGRGMPTINLPGIEVRPDGDVVRIELPAARLFQPGSPTLQPVAGTLIDTVAVEIARAYPDQTIGVEGHTDTDFIRTPQGDDNQQLSVARATAVYQYLVGARPDSGQSAVHRRPRQQPSGRVQRHGRRQGPQQPRRAGRLSGKGGRQPVAAPRLGRRL